MRALDPHSEFMEPEATEELKIETEGEFGGIGIELGIRDEYLTVIAPIEGTPAAEAGLMPLDRIVKIGDDLGMQSGLLISPKMYRRMLKPLHAEFIAFIKERTSAKVFFHTDGDVFDLVPDFIEIGIDILNPIQTSAGRMSDLTGLKQRYGAGA